MSTKDQQTIVQAPGKGVHNGGRVLLGVMGDPIGHSKSPAMHQAALQKAGITGAYVPLEVTDSSLEAALLAVKTLNFRGVNVTIPHKVAVMDYLDEIDEEARRIGAVNTVVNDHGTLKGYNTDGRGYVRSLKDEAVPVLAGKTFMVLGAGGAARGIIYALAQEKPAKIIIVNRTRDKAEALVQEWSDLALMTSCTYEDAVHWLPVVDVLINTTSVGMHPHTDQMALQLEGLRSSAVVSDLIYNPLETKLLREAARLGCTTHGGLGMFINQGAIAFEYWFGFAPSVETMRATVLSSLNKES
ncbi:shikimate dehydrogenase [Paenibacillus sp. JX-17]|uniref:Shikimate dehydrogenase (NADP(+)) n=1 Tax=Paenibacillus lacisoli TaxID=3064525 RepID=A0ABT9C8E0_9BACL|nr:shikimate dehydrogenase [Paenibacillus sp. JX-17]MDO7905509.1 shikimate dehydrogenase [Paenibacillus sp. JX-17]